MGVNDSYWRWQTQLVHLLFKLILKVGLIFLTYGSISILYHSFTRFETLDSRLNDSNQLFLPKTKTYSTNSKI